MKDGAIVCNAGHFDVEVDIPALRKMAVRCRRNVRPGVDEFELPDGRRIRLLAEGRLVSLAAAEGHPASVMDMSFAVQALMAEYVARLNKRLQPAVRGVPRAIDGKVAALKLSAMGIEIDSLTHEQQQYLTSWKAGT